MPQMKLFGNSRSAARVAGKRKPDPEHAPKEKKQKKKKPLKVLAIWLTVILCLEGSISSCATRRTSFVKLAHDLHSDGHVHHAPPVDGDVSAAEPVIDEVLRNAHSGGMEAVGDKESSWGAKARGHNAHRTRRAGGQAGRHRSHRVPTETMTQEDEQELAKEAFYELFWELDQPTMEAYVEAKSISAG